MFCWHIHRLPVIRNHAIEGYVILQQVSAPTHKAGRTIEVLRRTRLHSSHSQDLNPVDHKVWSVMEEQVFHTPIYDVNYLKQRLLDAWAE